MGTTTRLLFIVEEALLEAASSGSPQTVFGIVREGLLQILSAEPAEMLVPVGVVGPDAASGSVLSIRCGDRFIPVALTEGLPTPDKIQVVAVDQALDSRRVSVGPSGIARKRVLCIGTGSIGSMMALLLAEAGVRSFDLIDDDILEAHNLSRHICDLRDLGRVKVQAVAETLRWRRAQAEAIQADYCALPHVERRQLVAQADLVVASTDSVQAQFLANEDCVETRTPGVFVGAYERACGGEITIVLPGQGPCLYCCVGFRAGLVNDVSIKERRVAYQEADEQRLVAEPGLGTDIAYLASVACAYALALLDPTGSRGAILGTGGFKLLHGGSQPRDGYAELFSGGPFDFLNAQVVRHESCPVCGWRSQEVTT